jgi:hypothetical protein
MHNDANGHGGGNADDAVKDADALFTRLKRDAKADQNSSGQVNWRREAREDFDFEAGESALSFRAPTTVLFRAAMPSRKAKSPKRTTKASIAAAFAVIIR